MIVEGAVPANQRAGTDRLAESGYLLNDRRAGQASSSGWAAWNLLLSLIKVAPELAVELVYWRQELYTSADSYIGYNN